MAAAIARARIEAAMNSLPPKVQKFLNTHIRKGENFELKAELNSEYRDRRKEAVKRVIANMTVGKDVSGLFTDVLKCMQTDDLELKKLVYLYLMNYAKSQPDLVILAVNSFVKDVDDANPLIRALAVRTMGCLRADRIVDYLMEPLRKTLKDVDPYVRKTAAICVAKMYDLKPASTVDNGFVAALQDLLSDANPMVVANAVAALREIQENPRTKSPVFQVNPMVLHKLLAALNECTEWGQIFILESLAEYTPIDHAEAQGVVERVMPRLSHANGSVVLAAIRVLLVYLNYLKGAPSEAELTAQVVKKMSPPLVTLLASNPEMTYVALRNISVILQRRPEVLSSEIRVFFCKYNDPQYVKMEKLDVMMRLTNEKNVDAVLSELKEYANEVDVAFVRKAIRAMGTCAIKLEAATERCVTALLDLIKTRVAHVVQEAMIVLKDVFRKYPGKYEGIIPVLCEHLDVLDEEDARAALLWIVGEHADRIANAPDLLKVFVESFKDEHITVQLALLTASVKCFLRRPDTQPLVQQVLQLATGSELPDLRDRAFVYWRLLSSGADVRAVVGTCPPIEYESSGTLSPGLLDELVRNLGTLAAVWQKPVATVSAAAKEVRPGDEDEEDDELAGVNSPAAAAIGGGAAGGASGGAAPAVAGGDIPNLLDLDFDEPSQPAAAGTSPGMAMPQPNVGTSNLLDLLASSPPKPASPGGMGGGMMMGMGGMSPPSNSLGLSGVSPTSTPGGALNYLGAKSVLLPRDQGNGLEVSGVFATTRTGQNVWELTFTNHTPAPLSDFAVQFNKSTLGLNAAVPLGQLVAQVAPNGGAAVAALPLTRSPQHVQPSGNVLQAAIKSTGGIVYFSGNVPDTWLAASGSGSPVAGASALAGGGDAGLL